MKGYTLKNPDAKMGKQILVIMILLPIILSIFASCASDPALKKNEKTSKKVEEVKIKNNEIAEKTNKRLRIDEIEGLDSSIRNVIDKKGHTYADEVKHLYLSSTPVQTLKGISAFENLEFLFIYNSPLNSEELSKLKGLEKLIKLLLTKNGLNTLDGLPPLPALRVLGFRYNELSDTDRLVKKLQDYPKLQVLYLANNPLTEIANLGRLHNLNTIGLSNMGITDVDWVKDFKHVEKFYLNSNKLKSIEPFRSHQQLKTLTISGNEIRDLSPLRGKDELRSLSIARNPVSDLSPLKKSVKLSVLNAGSTEVEDISVLKNKHYLRELDFSYANLKSIEALRGKSNVQRLYLSGNPEIADEVIEILITMHESGSFSSSTTQVVFEDLELDLSDKNNYSKIKTLEESGVELSYHKGNIPPPFDADSGKSAPTFTMIDQNGTKVSLDDIDNDYIYVQVSAEWCGYCHKQAKYLEPFHNELKSNGLEDVFASVLMLSDENNLKEIQKKWTNEYGFEYILIPREGENLRGYHQGGIPGITIILPNRNIASTWSGASKNYEAFRKTLRSYIPELFEKH